MENDRILSFGLAKELSDEEIANISGGSSSICVVVSRENDWDTRVDGQIDS